MKQASSLSPEILHAFETVPDLYLILSPELCVLTASDPYLQSTRKERESLQGKSLLEVFPDNPAMPDSDATFNLRRSLAWVLQHRKPHQMPVQRYDVTNAAQPGGFEEKYWVPSNTPVLDKEGNIRYIIHKVEDVTGLELAQQRVALHELQLGEISGKQSETNAALAAARAEADGERKKLHDIVMQAPAMICMFKGPQHVFALVNPAYQQLVGERPLLGKPIAEAMPELAGQPIFGLLDKVYSTGESFYAYEMQVQLDHDNSGGLGQNYYNFTYQPIRGTDGRITGILCFAYEVTAQVEARRKVEERELTLQILNEQLSAANEELSAIQLALQELNQELELRVAERTQELQFAKAETEAQRNQLHQLIMAAPAPICILRGERFIYELVNTAYQELLPGRRLQGNSMLQEALSELANQPVAARLKDVYSTGETVEMKEELIRVARFEGGPLEDRYFNYTLQPRRDDLGRLNGILIYAFEVTKQVEARQAVERSAEQLRLVTDALPVLIGYLDKEEKYRFANKAYEAWFPMRSQELLGRPVREVVGENAYRGVKIYIERALAGERLDFESRMAYRPGFHKYIRTSYVPDIKNGKVAGFYTLVSDIPEQVETRQKIEEREQEALALAEELRAANKGLSRSNSALQELTQQQKQLVAIVENSADFIGLASPEGVGVYLNQAGREMVGIGEARIENYRVIDFFAPEEQPFVREEVLPMLLEKGRWDGELHFRHFRTGESIPVHYDCFAVKDPETGALLGLATITIDITERKEQEAKLQALTLKLASTNEDLRTANEQLTRTNIDLDNFIYTASHDLKAPISNIEGLMHILFEALPAEALTSSGLEGVTEMMEDSIERFKRTINHLTEVTKLQKENNQETVVVNLRDVIRDVSLDLSSQIEAAGAQLGIDVADCPGIRFSEKNLRSVVYNLLSNAIKYASPKRAPKVQVSCHPEGEYVVLRVRDNGLGMDLPHNPKLFSMFSRLHDHVEGTGIGLYMVKRIVENAEGRIEVESEVGVGSTFTVYFKK